MIGGKVKIIGQIIEELKFAKQEWLTLKLQNNKEITISKKLCEPVIENANIEIKNKFEI